MRRPVEHSVGRPPLDDLAGIHHGHVIGHPRDRAEIVRDEDDGHAVLPLQLLQQIQDLRLDRDVERRARLVGHPSRSRGDPQRFSFDPRDMRQMDSRRENLATRRSAESRSATTERLQSVLPSKYRAVRRGSQRTNGLHVTLCWQCKPSHSTRHFLLDVPPPPTP
jgi:hypothetical protein